MIIALIGNEEFSKEKRIEKFLQDTLGDRKEDPMAKLILFATDPNIESVAASVITACDSVSMFSPQQTVVVRKAEELKADDTRELTKWLSHKPDCALLFEFSKLDGRGEFYKTLKTVGEIEKFDEPPQYKMADWIASAIPAQFKMPIDRDACEYLADALGNKTKIVCEELKKVLMFQPDCKKFTLDLVKSMIVPQRKNAAYEINTPFGLRDVKAYTRILKEMFRNGVEAVPIVASLYYYAIDLLNYSNLLEQKVSPAEAAKRLGKSDYAFNKIGRAPECVQRWKKPLLCRVIRRLSDLDYEIKSGKCSTKTAQELALAALVVR